MGDEKITVTWDEIQKHDRPAKNFPAGFPPSEVPNPAKPAKPKRRTLLIVVCILIGLLVLGGAGAGTWLWLIKNSAGNVDERPTEATEIEQVMKQDAVCNQGAKSVADVVSRMRAIDTSTCPNDFRAAYLAHLHAWDMMADVEQGAIALKNESESAGMMVESLIRGFLGDPFGKASEVMDAQGQLQKKYKEAAEQVKMTFHRVEEIAVAHGARLPAK